MDWGQFRVSWGGFGAVLVQFGVALGQFGADWVQFAAIGGCLGSDLGPSGAICCPFMALSHLLRPLFLCFSPPNPLFPPNRPFSPQTAALAPSWSSSPRSGTPTMTSCTRSRPSSAPICPRRTKRYQNCPQKTLFFPQSDPSLPRVTWGADLGSFVVGLGPDLGSLGWTWGLLGPFGAILGGLGVTLD